MMLKEFRSRVVRFGFVKLVVSQLNCLCLPATAYSVARALDCSPPTARKLLVEMYNDGQLSVVCEPYANVHRKCYFVAKYELTGEERKSYSEYMNNYWLKKMGVKS